MVHSVPPAIELYPAGHFKHEEEDRAPITVLYVPAAHCVQTEAAVEEKVPATHCVIPPCAQYDPAAHCTQTDKETAPTTVLYVPAAHSVHADAPVALHVPTGQTS